MKKYIFTSNSLLALITLTASMYVANKVTGSPMGTVASKELLKLGAIDGQTLQSNEIWRLLTSQFLHSKQAHMIMNVILCWLAGSMIETYYGKMKFLSIYFLSGTIGILSSVIWYPEFVSSGSSQTMMALFASVFILKIKGIEVSKLVFWSSIFGTIAQSTLDLYVSHGLKMGHVTGFFVGFIMTLWLSRKESTQFLNNNLQI